MATLTIIVENVPDSILKAGIKQMNELDKNKFGVLSNHSDTYKLDFFEIPIESFIQIITSASSVHSMLQEYKQKNGN